MALSGDLSEFSIVDIIQLVELSKQTGGVQVRGQRGLQTFEGWLYFRDGNIIDATLPGLAPLDAAYALFLITSGPFQFHDNILPAAVRITQSNALIIMEGIHRQDAWIAAEATPRPALTMIPRLVPNPSSNGSEISLEAEEWRVLTMVNGRNTVGQIAQRSALGEPRTAEIITRLIQSGLIEHKAVDLTETFFPDVERVVLGALGGSARALLDEAYTNAGIVDRNGATHDQVAAAFDAFESAALRTFGAARVSRPLAEMRAVAQQAFPER